MKSEYKAAIVTAIIVLITIYIVTHYVHSVAEMVGLPVVNGTSEA